MTSEPTEGGVHVGPNTSRDGMRYWLVWLFASLPAIALVPLLSVPIPRGFHAAREVAGYFQALAFVRDGVASYGYVTLAESDAAIHLYSVLSAPLVAAGYVEGGRLVSAVAAVVAAIVVGWIASRLYGRVAGVLAVGGLWANPYFFRFAWGVTPEATSIALTAGAVAAALRYDDTDDARWFGVALLLLVFGVTNHGWEAVAALPVAAVVALRREWRRTGLVVVGTGAALVGVKTVVGLQPNGADTTGYVLGQSGSVLPLSIEWWGHWAAPLLGFPTGPFRLTRAVLFLGGLVAVVGAAYVLRRRRRRAEVVLVAWLLSGLVLPFALPGGAVIHYYYLWGVVGPLTVALAAVGSAVHRELVVRTPLDARTALRVLLVAVVVTGFVTAGLTGVRPTTPADSEGQFAGVDVRYAVDTTPDDLQPGEGERAGVAIRQYDVDDAGSITFVGNWTGWIDGYGDYYRSGAVRVMIYSDSVVRGVWHREPVSDRTAMPRFVEANDSVDDECDVAVRRSESGTASVRACSERGQ